MGLKSLKWEFETITGLKGTAANARAYLISIQLPSYGYDFRTIASWSKCVWAINERLEELEAQAKAEAEAAAKAAKANPNKEEEEELTELEKQILEKYNTLSLSWLLIKRFHSIKFKKDLKRLRRFISLWMHPDVNKDRKANEYMSIFNDILDTLKTKIVD